MARKTVRRNGRYITIDTKTGKEIKPGTAASKAAKGLYNRLRSLPNDMVKQAQVAAEDVYNNVIYSDKLDNKGRPQTIAQQRARERTIKNRKEGQKATLNGKPVVWKGGKWVSASTKRKGVANIPPAEGRPGSPSFVKASSSTKTKPSTKTKSSTRTKSSTSTTKKPAPTTATKATTPKKPAAPKAKGTETQQELQGTTEFIKKFSDKKGMERAVEQAKKRRDRLRKKLRIRSDAQTSQDRGRT